MRKREQMLNHNRKTFLEGGQVRDVHFQMLHCGEWKSQPENGLMGLRYPTKHQGIGEADGSAEVCRLVVAESGCP